jgi:hypothetical protein
LNLTINHLADEVLLEIFDSYRRGIDPYDQWREKYVWFNLTHVCRKWRAIMFASPSRLDLGIIVGPDKPGHIKTTLSGPLPIIVDYKCMNKDITGSALWRMRTALRHHDRVREIAFAGTRANFEKFFKETNCAFPVLESLFLQFEYGEESKLPDTFLGGPDLSHLHLRRLKLTDIPLASVSRLLLSTAALTDLSLHIDTVGPSQEASFLACFRGMHCLRSLRLRIYFDFLESPSQPSTPKDIVPLSKLTQFLYYGHTVFLEALVAGLSAPSLQDVDFGFLVRIRPLIVHLPRFINEIEEHYHAIHVHVTHEDELRFSLLTQSEYISRCKPHFNLRSSKVTTDLLTRMSCALSTKLTFVKELRVIIDKIDVPENSHSIPWRRFYERVPSVKALRTEGVNNYSVARTLLQDHGEPDDLAFLPALEEIDLGKRPLYRSERQIAAFQPFVSARQQAGRPVKVFFSL